MVIAKYIIKKKKAKVKRHHLNQSKFVIGFLISFLFGIFLADGLKIDYFWSIGLALGGIIALIFFKKNSYWRLCLLIFLGFTAGFSYFRYWDVVRATRILPYEKPMVFLCRISYLPNFSDGEARYILNCQEGRIEIWTNQYPEFSYGDQLKIKGVLKKPNDYLSHQGIQGVIFNPEKVEKIGQNGNWLFKIVYRVNDRFQDSLSKVLNEPSATLGAGLLFGTKGRRLPDSLMSDFNRTGMTHIVAVSGYNVTIIITYLGLLFSLLMPRFRLWGTLGAILFFVLMTGAPASVVRAGILGGLIVWGKAEGRRINQLILILLVASLMLLFNPYALKFDISFQLSFLAFAGIVYFSPIISQSKFLAILPRLLKEIFGQTLGAQIMVLPILLIYFGRLSIVSPLVNLLIIPLIPLTMLLIFFIATAALIWQPLGQTIAFLGNIFLKYIIVVVETFAKIPLASVVIENFKWWWLIPFYGVIGLVLWRKRRSFDEEF